MSLDPGLAGRVAFVTGASRGIGRASAQALAEEGLRLAIGYHEDKDSAAETVATCPDSMAVQIDITKSESVAAAFDEIEKSLGPVAVLVNNAGLRRDGLVMRMKDADWDDVIAANLTGTFRCTRRALPNMLKARWGRVITIGSVAGSLGNAGQANYAAAKAGLVGFSKSIAREVAKHGVTANVVVPGLVDTAMTAGLSDAQREKLVERVPLGRPGTTAEVAEAVRFCARASYLTGAAIAIDGGLA
ncbi:MAG: 3-oxoacyl-ACP reductase FabG [Actinomycetota bacterium]